jgi:hypothetical protein
MLALTAGNIAAAADVTVYIQTEGKTLTYVPKVIATALFQRAGVSIDWRTEAPFNAAPATWLSVELAEPTPQDLLPGALAYSHPYARNSKQIIVFIDRIRCAAPSIEREASLLAYVLVHEITHVLQGVEHHSETGIMKAHWSPGDRADIFARRLGFAEEDVAMLRQGLTHWYNPSQKVTGPSESGIAYHPE